MKSLRFVSMLLVSHREKKARKIEFHPSMTVIQGENDTGKSSIIKSVLLTFGAEPRGLHPKWKDASVITLVRFEVDGNNYAIYKHARSYSLFDGTDKLIGTYTNVTEELAPVIAQLFGFHLKLTDREGRAVTPPPAYYLLPFYIDQDKGWTDKWSSFLRLGQFSHWQERVVGYHLGLRPDRWYALSADKKDLESGKDEPTRQINALKDIRIKTHEEVSSVDFDIDVDAFRIEIERLLHECSELRNKESAYKSRISNLATEKIRLEAQIEIVAKTHDELSADYKLSQSLQGSSVACPTCGVEHENSFAERFAIAQDTETCNDLLASLHADLEALRNDSRKTTLRLQNATNERQRISNILATKQGKLKLQDVIRIEGKKSLLSHLDAEMDEHLAAIGAIDIKIEEIEGQMKRYENKERTRAIKEQFGEAFRRNALTLGVNTLPDSAFGHVNPSIDESGSDLPRALLAYFYAVLFRIRENDGATFFPIIIDAPNQQEQDAGNLEKMLTFIRDKAPEGSQVLLGLVDDKNVEFGGKTIRLDDKYSVLSESQYRSVCKEIAPFEQANLELDRNYGESA